MMIIAYSESGHGEEALALFYQMQIIDIKPNQFTFASALPACANLADLEHGKEIHGSIIRCGFQADIFVGNALVNLSAKCRSILDARQVFAKMPHQDMILWNAMITVYAQNENKISERNYVSCAAMIAGFAQNGYSNEAQNLYREMQLKGVKPNSDTFASVLPAYANLGYLHAGKEVHEDIIRNGCVSDVFVGSALVDMYAKCGSLEDAQKVFEKMPRRDVVSWTTMIAGYAQNGHVDEALNFFQKMPERNLVSWNVMIAGFMQNGHFDEAFKLFRQMQLTGSALVDMYAKCGSIKDARKMFDNMLTRDVVSCTAMIVGYAMHGYGKEAIQLFEQIQHSGTKPDHITFVGVLFACCHAGLVDDGWQYFECMRQNYHIMPAVEHYCCMIDLLSCAGCLDEALDFVNKMPMKPDATVWRSLLGVYRNHTNIKLGHVAECLFEADPKNVAYYVLLSNIYAAVGSYIDVNYKMKEAGYAPNTNFVLHDVEEEQKNHVLCQHNEKLAIAFGLLQTCPRTTIQIIKNL
eukprot:Gb_22483 [translate_table: standard]